MRKPVTLLLLAFYCLIPAMGRSQRPIPPGIREADKQSNKPLDPPISPVPNAFDPAKLKQEAAELAQISAEVPEGFSLVAKGQIPKDLADRLKRIEKLAKHLRSEITR